MKRSEVNSAQSMMGKTRSAYRILFIGVIVEGCGVNVGIIVCKSPLEQERLN